MAKINPIDLFYMKDKSPLEFKFESLVAPPLFSMIPMQLDAYLSSIVRSPKYAAKINQKYKIIDDCMEQYGFKKLGGGTNRVVYRSLTNDTIVLKIAIDRVGANDNPCEMLNQRLLAPFVTKCFEVSPSGVIGLFERVQPITYKDEFKSVAGDIYDLIVRYIIGKYVLADIGTNFYMNWGLREGFGPVLLDFPYVYEMDGKKLYCNNEVTTPYGKVPCGGMIDYDDGFNFLKCEKCGKTYFAQDLQKEGQIEIIAAGIGGKKKMGIKIFKNGELIKNTGEGAVSFDTVSHIEPPDHKKKTFHGLNTKQTPRKQVEFKVDPVKQEAPKSASFEVSAAPKADPAKYDAELTKRQVQQNSGIMKGSAEFDSLITQATQPKKDQESQTTGVGTYLKATEDTPLTMKKSPNHYIRKILNDSYYKNGIKAKESLMYIVMGASMILQDIDKDFDIPDIKMYSDAQVRLFFKEKVEKKKAPKTESKVGTILASSSDFDIRRIDPDVLAGAARIFDAADAAKEVNKNVNIVDVTPAIKPVAKEYLKRQGTNIAGEREKKEEAPITDHVDKDIPIPSVEQLQNEGITEEDAREIEAMHQTDVKAAEVRKPDETREIIQAHSKVADMIKPSTAEFDTSSPLIPQPPESNSPANKAKRMRQIPMGGKF